MVGTVINASLPWLSIDARDERYLDISYPMPTREEVDRCMNCTQPICTNCLDPMPKNRLTGRPCGRPKKRESVLDGQQVLWAVSVEIETRIN